MVDITFTTDQHAQWLELCKGLDFLILEMERWPLSNCANYREPFTRLFHERTPYEVKVRGVGVSYYMTWKIKAFHPRYCIDYLLGIEPEGDHARAESDHSCHASLWEIPYVGDDYDRQHCDLFEFIVKIDEEGHPEHGKIVYKEHIHSGKWHSDAWKRLSEYREEVKKQRDYKEATVR